MACLQSIATRFPDSLRGLVHSGTPCTYTFSSTTLEQGVAPAPLRYAAPRMLEKNSNIETVSSCEEKFELCMDQKYKKSMMTPMHVGAAPRGCSHHQLVCSLMVSVLYWTIIVGLKNGNCYITKKYSLNATKIYIMVKHDNIMPNNRQPLRKNDSS